MSLEKPRKLREFFLSYFVATLVLHQGRFRPFSGTVSKFSVNFVSSIVY